MTLGVRQPAAAQEAGRAGDIAEPNRYEVRFQENGDVAIAAELLVKTGSLVMVPGFKSDTRAVNVADLRLSTADGTPLVAQYDPNKPEWRLSSPAPGRVRLSYVVHLSGLRTLPTWAHLQYGFFDGDAVYVVTRGLFIYPDSTEPTDTVRVRVELPPGAELAAPWPYDTAHGSYATTMAKLVNNSLVEGHFRHVDYREGGFSVRVALLGSWPQHRPVVERVVRASVARDLQLFPSTPPDQYVVTLASGDEDGQSFETSNAISTRLPVNTDDTEIWANTIAHELFHHWNARLMHSSDKRLGFFVEGFTEYYANREILAESLIDRRRYWSMAALHLGAYSYFAYSPNYGVSIADAGLDKTKNRFGVYDGGWTVALCLDLMLRSESHGRQSLDSVMRKLWERYGLTAQPLTYVDVVNTVGDVMGHDMTQFFQDYVGGTQELPFRDDLARIGVAAYDQPFGGEAYLTIEPHAGAQQQAYEAFMSGVLAGSVAPLSTARGLR
jgi:predicted metalloprotease with PDZ domain